MFTEKLIFATKCLLNKLSKKNIRLVVAESCTGGLLSGLLTTLPGSSKVFERGFITYSNEAKIEILGVPKDLIDNFGAVSKEVAISMAENALIHSLADVSIAITGIAGPSGGSNEKPVGKVYLALGIKNQPSKVQEFFFVGSRNNIRMKAIENSIILLNNI